MTYDPFVRGPHPVGVRTIELWDEARENRPITIEAWYPAAERYRGEDLAETTNDRFAIVPGFEATQEAVREADPARGRFPLIAYSHGSGSDRRDAAHLCTHIASHGYVIVSTDHVGDRMGETAGDSGQDAVSLLETLPSNRIGDVRFIIDRALESKKLALAALIEPERIGTMGGSFGGWTSIAVNSYDRRPKAVFAVIPAWGQGPLRTELLTAAARLDDWQRRVPVFLLAGDRDALVRLEGTRQLYRDLRPPKHLAVLAEASHFHFANEARQRYERAVAGFRKSIGNPVFDFAEMVDRSPDFAELCPVEHAHEVAKGIGLAHMDTELKGNSSARAFLDSDLARLFAARGIAIEIADEPSALTVLEA